jgi:hypothetical protein
MTAPFLMRSEFRPQIVLGTGRSGAVVSGITAGFLANLPIMVVDVDWRVHGERPLLAAAAALAALDPKTRILCVEAEEDTGNGFRQVQKALSPTNAECKLGTLWRTDRPPKPDYFVLMSEEKPRWPFRIGNFRPL